jgi:hypothetical protein
MLALAQMPVCIQWPHFRATPTIRVCIQIYHYHTIVFNSRAGPHKRCPHVSCQERSGEFPHQHIQPPDGGVPVRWDTLGARGPGQVLPPRRRRGRQAAALPRALPRHARPKQCDMTTAYK